MQLDGVRLNWADTHAANYKVRISYDGARWSTAYSTTTGNGGDDFVGINGKARLIRLEFGAGSYGLDSLEVTGSPLAKQNLLGGRNYSVTPAPNDKPDSGFESTDGLLADDWGDGRSYGFGAGQETANVVFDLGSTQTVDSARIHAYEEYPAYRPDKVTVAVSTDGTNYVQKGWLPGTPNDQSKVWYDFDFPASTARYVKITFQKTYTADASAMFVDEIEVYGGSRDNLAKGAAYTKEPAPNAGYPDTGNKESTDGVIAGGHPDTFSYGYTFAVGTTGTAKVTVDLGSAKEIGQVVVRDNFDNVTKYSPDVVRVSVGNSPTTLTKVGESGTSATQWFQIPVQPVTARYVQVEFQKASTGAAADWIFVDEIAVYPPS